MDSLISDGRYNDLLSDIRITSNTTLVVEVIVRAVRIVLWTQNSRYAAGTFLGVSLPNLQLLFTSIVVNIILNISIFFKFHHDPYLYLSYEDDCHLCICHRLSLTTSIISASVVKLYKYNKATGGAYNCPDCCSLCQCVGGKKCDAALHT